MYLENVDWKAVLPRGRISNTNESFSRYILSNRDNYQNRFKFQLQTFSGCSLKMLALRSSKHS